MLKGLATWKYVIVVAIVLGGCVYVSRQDQETRQQYQEKCTQLNAGTASPSTHGEDCDKGADDAARHLPRWYRVFSWPEGITTWAILLTLFAIAEQTNETRRAATAAIDAAQAAQRTIDLTMHTQRGRIAISFAPAEGIGEIVEFSAENIGNSNVKIRYARGFRETVRKQESLPDVPPYLAESNASNMADWIMPGGKSQIRMREGDTDIALQIDLRPEATRYNIRWSGDALWVYGRICYEDGISPEIREKRFCYSVTVDGAGRMDLISGGPLLYSMDT